MKTRPFGLLLPLLLALTSPPASAAGLLSSSADMQPTTPISVHTPDPAPPCSPAQLRQDQVETLPGGIILLICVVSERLSGVDIPEAMAQCGAPTL